MTLVKPKSDDQVQGEQTKSEHTVSLAPSTGSGGRSSLWLSF